jgi:hypothetical protein
MSKEVVNFFNEWNKHVNSTLEETPDQTDDGEFKRETKHPGSKKRKLSKQIKKTKQKIAAASRRKNR